MTVSVVIAAFNAEQIVERAIGSALNQTEPPHEILVVDDASTDSTRDVVQRISERWPTVKLLALPTNKGPSGARNAAINAAEGQWLAILDADDAWKPERLATLTRLGDARAADFVADNLIFYDHAAGREGRNGFEVPWQLQQITTLDFFENEIQETSPLNYGLLKPLIRRSFLLDRSLRYKEGARYAEDAFFYAELLFNGASAWLTSKAMYIYTTRIGEFSREWSTLSKSVPRFDLIVEMSDELERKYADKIDSRLRRVMKRRRARVRAIHLANVAREYRESGRWLTYVALVLSDLDLLGLLVFRTRRRIVSRLTQAFRSRS